MSAISSVAIRRAAAMVTVLDEIATLRILGTSMTMGVMLLMTTHHERDGVESLKARYADTPSSTGAVATPGK